MEEYNINQNAWVKAREYLLKNTTPGKLVLELVEKAEQIVRDEGSELAFPINFSRNFEAAHYTPISQDSRLVEEDDIIKIDIGVHKNGYILDSAFTIDLSEKHKDIVDASKYALYSALEYVEQEGSESQIGEIGRRIEDEIKKYKLEPIYNLTGHSIDRYNLHSGKSIFNYNTNSKQKIGDGTFAIEPFATNGAGRIKNGSLCGIYFPTQKQSRDRNINQLINEIKKFNNLPFAQRWIGKNMLDTTKKITINKMVNEGIIRPAPVLVEIDNGLVSQHEKTVIIKEGEVKILPKIEF